MVAAESVLKIGDGHLCVELGAVDGTVTEKLLDVADGSTASQEVGGARVPEPVQSNRSAARQPRSVKPENAVLHGSSLKIGSLSC